MVLGHPEGVVAQLFGAPRLLQHLAVELAQRARLGRIVVLDREDGHLHGWLVSAIVRRLRLMYFLVIHVF